MMVCSVCIHSSVSLWPRILWNCTHQTQISYSFHQLQKTSKDETLFAVNDSNSIKDESCVQQPVAIADRRGRKHRSGVAFSPLVFSYWYDRISGGAASDKNIKENVCAQIEKNFARAKWKVNPVLLFCQLYLGLSAVVKYRWFDVVKLPREMWSSMF